MRSIQLHTLEEMKDFIKGNKKVEFHITSREEKYETIRSTLVRLSYQQQDKKGRGIIKRFLSKITGYSHIQIKRLIAEWKNSGLLYVPSTVRGRPKRIYGSGDIALLIKTDIAHSRLNGKATQKILQREYMIFGKDEYATISKISVSHLYNIRRENQQYRSSKAMTYVKTQAVATPIGERRKPTPYGVPGFFRVDSVHQGDLDKEKGVYHINLVDEVTQYEYVACVPHITIEHMIPTLRNLIDQCPFIVQGFHSDNGSEYINYEVARLLKTLIIQQTKSRSRKTNDQALVEGKNGSIIRKHMGRNFIAKTHAERIQQFYQEYFNTYLNYHRTCLYPNDFVDKRGKVKKKYNLCMTPYERLRSLEQPEQCLKPSVTFEILDTLAYTMSDNEFAEKMQTAKSQLFKEIARDV